MSRIKSAHLCIAIFVGTVSSVLRCGKISARHDTSEFQSVPNPDAIHSALIEDMSAGLMIIEKDELVLWPGRERERELQRPIELQMRSIHSRMPLPVYRIHLSRVGKAQPGAKSGAHPIPPWKIDPTKTNTRVIIRKIRPAILIYESQGEVRFELRS